MRKRIEELAEGRVECAVPVIEFSVSRIEIEVLEEEDYRGEFTITGKNQISLRGAVSSSSPRITCLTEEFEGEKIRIRYQFHSTGLTEGDRWQGSFFILCGQREHALSFTASILRKYPASAYGSVKSPADFSALAQKNWQEAVRVFYDPAFQNVLKKCDVKTRLLYAGLFDGSRGEWNVEEFLLACGLKEPVSISVSQTEFQFAQVSERTRQDIVLSKSTWGYVDLAVSCDAAFLKIEKSRMTSEDFLGSEAKLLFYVCPEAMHAGKNFGRIVFGDATQEIAVTVCAKAPEAEEGRSVRRRSIQKLQSELLKTYVEYRLKKIVTGRWASITCGILEELAALEPQNYWYRLFHAQTLWTNGQKQDAEWMLNEFKRKCRDRKSPQWGYYMYICTLKEHEELYIDRLTEEIEQIYLEHQENGLLFWCLLFLRKEYVTSGHLKIKALERRIMHGTQSPLLYAEAYGLYCSEPYLLCQLGEFEFRILNWARRQKMLTKALVEQIVSVFPERIAFRETVFALLADCYDLMDCARELIYGEKMSEDKRVLAAICGYLIRNQKYGERFFHWYALGVKEKLRITGLYEAYLMSMDAKGVQEVPQIIQMYFKYNNQLGAKQKATLYVNVIAAKEAQPRTFAQRYPAMEKFAFEQMEAGRMDQNLAVIYKEVLSRGIYSPQISDALSDVLFLHRLTCMHPHAWRVIVYQEQMQRPTIAAFVDHVACFPLYSNAYCIFIEDRSGRRICAGIEYQLEKLMQPGRYIRACRKYSPGKLPYLLYYFASRKEQTVFAEEDAGYFRTVLEADEVRDAYKAELLMKLLALLHALGRTEELEREMARMDVSLLSGEQRGALLKICLEHRLWEAAYRMAASYGCKQPAPKESLPLLEDRIHRTHGAEESVLLHLCAEAFFAGVYSDETLRYLCRHYHGPLRQMKDLLHKARELGVDAAKLAGRILVQMLYTAEFSEDIGEIYRCCEAEIDGRVKQAYLTCFSSYRLVEGASLPDGFFKALQNWRADGNALNPICGLALLQYYALLPSLEEKEEKQAEGLIQTYLFQGMCFSFFRNFGQDLLVRYQLYDKYFIEYQTRKPGPVWVRYKKKEEASYVTGEMTEACEGMFVKKMILFYGEEVVYDILEEADGKKEVVRHGEIHCSFRKKGFGRYDRLNEMTALLAEGNASELAVKMDEYRQLDGLVDEMFTALA